MRRITAILVAFAPGAALANVGVGYFMVALPVVALALIPAILLEAPVLRFLLEVTLRRALLLSLIANLLSALFGFVLGFAFDFTLGIATGVSGLPPTRAAASIMLGPWFLLSWWIEHSLIAKRMAAVPRPVVRRATGIANLLTYALMLVAAQASPLFPVYDSSVSRARVTEAILAAGELRGRVTEFWQTQKRFPTDPRELGYSPSAAGRFVPTLEKYGRIVVRIEGTGNPAIDGKRIELVPRQDDASGGLRWVCAAPDIEPRNVPGSCRQQVN